MTGYDISSETPHDTAATETAAKRPLISTHLSLAEREQQGVPRWGKDSHVVGSGPILDEKGNTVLP